ncbi:MAG: DUF4956 domain-containing protein [Saprospiraceae bacterium]|nr:DUF4956 domain-containing protein [Saprospiraceae bacterium]
MNILQQLQERYIQEFSNNMPFDEFLVNVITTAVLAGILRWYYIRYGNALSNRSRFAANFMPLALGTLLIIMIIKSSIALSLGLVGALSIVRYRAAIKDPEELTFLFIAVGLGLAGGANQPILGAVAFSLMIILLYAGQRLWGKRAFQSQNKLIIHIHTDSADLNGLAAIMGKHLSYVELKRVDAGESGLDASFLGKADDVAQLAALKDEVLLFAANTRISIVEQPALML